MLQATAEMLISPIGYAMIGKLAPRKYQGHDRHLDDGHRTHLVIRRPILRHGPRTCRQQRAGLQRRLRILFVELGQGIKIVGFALVASIPFLRKLIKGKSTPANDMSVTVVPVNLGGVLRHACRALMTVQCHRRSRQASRSHQGSFSRTPCISR